MANNTIKLNPHPAVANTCMSTGGLCPTEAAILQGIAADIANGLAVDLHAATPDEREQCRDARSGVARLVLNRWLGPLSETQRRAANRAINRLADKGLVSKLYTGARTSHLGLTTEGRFFLDSNSQHPQQG